MKMTSKMKTTLKMKATSIIGLPPQIILPTLPLKSYLNFIGMTSHLDSHTTTDVKPDMLSGVQTKNGFHMIDIIYVALPCVHKQKKYMECKVLQILTFFSKIEDLSKPIFT